MDYYTHTCKCGCGGQIEIRESHKYDGIPLYIKGHHLKYRTKSKEEIRKLQNSIKNSYKNGRIAWNKDLTKEIDVRVKNNGEKTSKALKIYFSIEENRNKISLKMKGKSRSEETKSKLREANKGSNHPQWQNGISFEPYGIEFNKELKQFIKNRDFNICQNPNCMNTKGLCIHHIDYDKKNNNLSNLTTLCNSCHSKTNLIEYFGQIITRRLQMSIYKLETLNKQEVHRWLLSQ